MFATAFNDRFFTYTYPQRLGAAIDWYEFLGADRRGDLFDAWGAIPDPDCCVPGDAGLPGALGRARPTASSGARATTSCSPSSAARATSTRPATSRTRRSTPRPRTGRVDQRQ